MRAGSVLVLSLLGVVLARGRVLAGDLTDVVPIIGGAFGPGPRAIGGMGLQVEPNTITNFDGTVALAYLVGKATDGAGRQYRMSNDMRVFRGTYVGSDGMMHQGTFGFI